MMLQSRQSDQSLCGLPEETVDPWLSTDHSVKTNQVPVVQSIVSLTSSLVVKMLSVLVSTLSNSQVFLLKKKCE